MWPGLIGFLISLFVLCQADVQDFQFFPLRKQSIYDVYFNGHSGTRKPAMFSSSFGFRAKLHIQGLENNSIAALLTDINYKLDNGRFRDNNNIQYVPIPNEAAEALQLPFKIQFDLLGLIENLEVESSDKEWSINMKKAIASTLQINKSFLTRNDESCNRVGITNEPTIYGECEVDYHINTTENATTLMKSINTNECNSDFDFVTKNFADNTNNRIYKILYVEEQHLLDQIWTHNQLISSPQIVPNDVFTSETFQKFQLLQIVDIENKIILKNPKYLRDLTFLNSYLSCEGSAVDEGFDITAGRANYNVDSLVEKVNDILDEYFDYFETKNITVFKPNMKNVTLLQKLLPILEMFDVPSLEKNFELIAKKFDKFQSGKRNFLLKLLPYVGTRASIRLIRKLIAKKSDLLTSVTVVEILSAFPENLKCINEKLLIELEDLLTIGEYDLTIHSASVLAFSNLLHKVYKNTDQRSPLFKKYTELLIQKFSEAKEYSNKVLYLEALSNIETDATFKYLRKIASGEVVTEGNLRTLALHSIAPKLIKESKVLLTIVLPILVDRQANSDLRLAAYYIFIKTEKPTLNRFMKLNNIMQKETNEKFYSFHYSTLKSLSELSCNSPDKCELVKISKAVLKLSRKPLKTNCFDSTFILDSVDNHYGFEMNLETLSLSYSSGFTLRTQTKVNWYGRKSSMFSIYINSDGKFPNSTNSSEWFYPKIHTYEVVIKRNSQTIFATGRRSETELSTFKILGKIFMGFLNTTDPYLDIFQFSHRTIISDLGVPIRIFEITPMVIQLSHNKRIAPLQLNLKLVATKIVQNSIYNPINDLWHGVQEIDFFGLEIPFTIHLELVKSGFRISFEKYPPDDHTISAQTYVTTQVFIEGNDNRKLLSEFHQNVDVYETVTRGDNYRKELEIESSKYELIGKSKEVKVYDCEQEISRGTLIKKRAEQSCFEIFVPSGIETCGLRWQFVPLANVSKVDLEVQLDFATTENHYLFAKEATLQLKNMNNTTLLSYDSLLILNVSKVFDSMGLNFNLSRRNFANETKNMHLDFFTKFYNAGVHTELNFTFYDSNQTGLGQILTKFDGSSSSEVLDIFNKKQILFRECEKELIGQNMWSPITKECLYATTSLRNYTASIDIKNSENYHVKQWIKQFNVLHANIYKFQDKILMQPADDGHYHLGIIFPVFRKDEVDITFQNNETTQIYTGVPYTGSWITPFQKFGPQLRTELLKFLMFYLRIETLPLWNVHSTCIIAPNYVLNLKGYFIEKNVSSEWRTYFKNDYFMVRVKRGDSSKLMALQVKIKNGKNESTTDDYQIFSKNNTFILTLNGFRHELIAGKDTSLSNIDIWFTPYPEILHLIFKYKNLKLIVTFDGESINLNMKEYVPGFNENKGICVD